MYSCVKYCILANGKMEHLQPSGSKQHVSHVLSNIVRLPLSLKSVKYVDGTTESGLLTIFSRKFLREENEKQDLFTDLSFSLRKIN